MAEKIDIRQIPLAARADIVRFYEARLEHQRRRLEDLKCESRQSDVLRGRIVEIRELLRNFDSNQPAKGLAVWGEDDD